MTPGAEEVRDHLRSIYSPMDRRTVVEWCEDELYLSERQTQMPGKFNTKMTPYLREPLNCYADGDVTDLVLVFATQTAKTTMIQAGTAWRIANKPTPVVWVMPNESLAQSFSETRWIPLIEDSPTMAALMPNDKNKFKNLEQHFSRCSLVFCGSNSPANLASRPAGLLNMDEMDKFGRETALESSAVHLAENRTKSFVGALRVKTSTPTVPEGAIWAEYKKGTQEKYMIPCVHCVKHIELVWEQVRWSQDAKKGDEWNLQEVEESAHYICPHCAGVINNGQKIEMMQTGKWVATNFMGQKGFRSFHLNSLYAPWRSCSFGSLAVKFLKDTKTTNGLQDFTNSTMALPWEQVTASVGDATIQGLRGQYLRGTVPTEDDDISLVTCADIGQDAQHWGTVAFNREGVGWLIDYGKMLTPEDLLELQGKTYYTPEGKARTAECGLLDSGFATFRVYGVCQQSNGFFYPSKGSNATFGSKIGKTVIQEFPGVVLHSYVDHALKTELFIDRFKNRLPPIFIPQDSTNDLIRGLSGQQLVPKGHDGLVWKSLAADHYADVIKLCCLAWHFLKNE